MANATLSAAVLADLATAAPLQPEDSGAVPLVSLVVASGRSPLEAVPDAYAQGSLSAWAPANRANPICEVVAFPTHYRRIVFGGVAATVAVATALWLSVAA
ncbi:MAG: hypothetical protein JKY37_21675 [Nannocystaceae bacterium]|nr:hypothetical protein [Nannocystaceae bacterium]